MLNLTKPQYVICYAIPHYMLIKISRQEAIKKFPNLPLRHYDPKEDEYVFNYPKVFANYILTLPSKSYKGHIKLVGTELVTLTYGLDCDSLIFLGDENISWLHRYDTYENFQESLQYLADNKIGKRFNGALQVDITEIPTFTKHLAWLVRTNGILPYIHFVDPGQNIIGEICQYGNLHFSTMNKKSDNLFKELVSRSKFEFMSDTNCINKFSKSSRIKNRSIVV
jgi:hypothetical protein